MEALIVKTNSVNCLYAEKHRLLIVLVNCNNRKMLHIRSYGGNGMKSRIFGQAKKALKKEPTNIEVAEWAWKNVRMNVKGDSWRVYKSEHLRSIEDISEREAVRDLYNKLQKETPPMRRRRRVSTVKKGINNEEMELLLNELRRPMGNANRDATAKLARLWLVAAKATGLRPVEWLNAEVTTIEGEEFIKCRNAKVVDWEFRTKTMADQGRIRSFFRVVPIGHLSAIEIECVRAMAGFGAAQDEEGFIKMYNSVRSRIRGASKRLWPDEKKIPSLYSARHAFRDSFEARLLADGISTSQVELLVSIVMGHGSKLTKYAYGSGNDEYKEAERTIAVDALLAQKNVLMGWALSQIE